MTMDIDAPLDFEFEDPLSLPTPKRRRVIDLDDLLTDHYKEERKHIEKASKQAIKSSKSWKLDDQDDDEDDDATKVTAISQIVTACQHQVHNIQAENEIPLWGARVFGDKKSPPPFVFPQLGNCSLLLPVLNNGINSVLELTPEKGQSFLEGLLKNGWLLELILTCAHLEESVATWTIYLMLYSSNEDLRTSACNFWCTILSCKHQTGLISIRDKGFPSYSDLKSALEVYGFDASKDFSSLPEVSHAYSDCEGPPQNIRLWVKLVAVCCQVRSTISIFSNSSEVEELLGVIITFFLERKLQGLSRILQECMLSVISCFTDEEWHSSCEGVAKSLASKAQENSNCLRLVECISGVDARSRQLRREVAFQSLVCVIDMKVSDGEEILRFLMTINVKDQDFSFNTMYIYLVLTDYWLISNPILEEKPVILEMWVAYLRICSCQVASTDMRPCASKVRNKASYILQGTVRIEDDK